MVRLGWTRSPQSIEVRFGTSHAGAVDVALYTTSWVDAIPAAHPEVDSEQLRVVEKGRRSPLRAAGILGVPEAACAYSRPSPQVMYFFTGRSPFKAFPGQGYPGVRVRE